MAVQAATQRILVVEDDPSIAEVITWALGDAGFAVRTAPTLTEALSIIGHDEPDLVVADYVLPDGLGSELVRRVRERHRAATLMVSAHPGARAQASAVGADACLQKPFDLDEFFETIDTLLHRAPDGPSWSAND
ncbi:MAG TPA: response regulator transcription factor [Thermomicrobiaceae bacterium]|nr:response regulator transcription factor [Thermomicrobiaceae bacterium]